MPFPFEEINALPADMDPEEREARENTLLWMHRDPSPPPAREYSPIFFDREHTPEPVRRRPLVLPVYRGDGRKAMEPTSEEHWELDPELLGGKQWKCLQLTQILPGQFKGYRLRAKLEIFGIWEGPSDPDDVISELINNTWALALQRALDFGITPRLVFATVESVVLEEGDLNCCYRIGEEHRSPAERLFEMLQKIDQSNKKKNRRSLIEEPFSVDLNVIELKPLTNQQKFAGAGRKRANPVRPNNVYPGALLNMPTVGDRYCLFRSVVLLVQRELMDCKQFHDYKKRPNGQLFRDVETLLESTGIDPARQYYSIKDFGDQIQKYLTQKWPGKFRLYGFNADQTDHKPFYWGPVDTYECPISVYYWGEQEDYVPCLNPGLLFQADSKYCFVCERHYHRNSKHKNNCKAKCQKCQRVGPMHPCREEANFYQKCNECHKTFKNRGCYHHHLTPFREGQKTVCQKNKQCQECGVCYTLANQSREGHVCGRVYCRHCGAFHARNGYCSMKFHQKKEKPKRYIVYDFECQTKDQPDPHLQRFVHRANFCWATVFCSNCVDDGRWNREFNNNEWCEICGFHRNFAFSEFEIAPELMPSVHVPVEDEALLANAFTDWLLEFEKKKFTYLDEVDPRRQICPFFGREEEAEDQEGGEAPDADQMHPGVAEEDELYQEYGIHMSPRRGEHFNEDDEDNEEAAEGNRGEEDAMEGGSRQRQQQRKKKTKKLPNWETTVYAHCAGRYDSIFIFAALIEKGNLTPKLIRQHNRLLEMRVFKRGLTTNLIFKDSYSIIPLPISRFVSSFGLQIPGTAGKLYFPHEFNQRAFYTLVNQGPPPANYYGPDSMKPAMRKAFLEWHEAERRKGEPWVLKDKIVEYCRTDVEILLHGLVSMIQLFRRATTIGDITKTIPRIDEDGREDWENATRITEVDRGIDITAYLTLPSACVAFFLKTLQWRSHLPCYKYQKIAITPHMGYERKLGKSSQIARCYIKWLMHRHAEDNPEEPRLVIQYWDSPEGEMRLCNGRYAVDGFIRRPGHPRGDKAVEVFGCYWHACPQCHPDPEEVLIKDQTARMIREKNQKRLDAIRQECEVELIWEHQITQAMEEDWEMADFFAAEPNVGPLDYREAFFGGRTGPEVMNCQAGEINRLAEKEGIPRRRVIKMKDFCSQYPFVLYTTRFPITHPTVKKWEPMREVNWEKPEQILDPDNDNVLEGIVKGWIVPPEQVRYGVPVAPYKSRGRLLFPLCKTCANAFPDGLYDPDYSCPHMDRQNMEAHYDKRGWMITITTMELEMALEAGYIFTMLHSAYLWPKYKDWSQDLFHPYIETMLKIKMESSGWPKDCTDPEMAPDQRELAKLYYVQQAREFNVKIDPENVQLNPGMRLLSKLCLNSLWGRFALRAKLPRAQVVDLAGMAELLDNRQIDVDMFEPLSAEKWLVCYISRDQAVVEHGTHNPIIALWTTSAARCHLLRHMQGIYSDMVRTAEADPAPLPRDIRPPPEFRRRDTKLCYYDTDSLVYTYDEKYGDPLPTGEQLGELTEEWPNHRINSIWTNGPKIYLLELLDMVSGEEQSEMKVRSVTLDHETTGKMSAERFKAMSKKVAEGGHDSIKVNKNVNFVISKNKKEIASVPMEKTVSPSINKGVLTGQNIVPFGYSKCFYCDQKGFSYCICLDRTKRPKIIVPPQNELYLPFHPNEFPDFLRKWNSPRSYSL